MIVLFNGLQAGNRSGTGVYTEQLARRLPGLGDDVEMRVAWPRSMAPASPSAGEQVFMPRGTGGILGRICYDQVGIPRDARRLGADLLHYPANVGCVRGGVRQVVTVHDLSFFREPAWHRFERAAYYRWAVARSVRRAERVITVSRATAAEVRERLGFPEDRIDVVPNGVDERFQPAPDEAQTRVRARYALPERFILYVGTHEPRKNLVRLIQAWSAVAGGCEQDLVLGGRAGWKHAPVRAEAERCGHGERVHFPGFIDPDDLPAVMSAADAFVYPSLYEGFGIPVVEAMACGTAVLTSNVASLPEVAGDAALLVDPREVDDIAAGLTALAENDGLRAELERKGLVRSRAYAWRRTAELTLDVYRAALAL